MSADTIVVSDIKQLKILNDELRNLGKRMAQMREAKKVIEARLVAYFERTKRTGAKTSEVTVLTKEKVKTGRKSQDEKKDEIMQLLAGCGIQNTHEMYEKITDAMRGEKEVTTAVVIKPTKKK
jgi:hypothetical protein